MKNKTETELAIVRAVDEHKDGYPHFSKNLPSMAAFVSKEAGSLLDAALTFKYKKGGDKALEDAEKFAIRTIAASYRFLGELNKKLKQDGGNV